LAGGATSQSVKARLMPVGAAMKGSGNFTATGASGSTVTVSWQLSVSGLGAKATRARLQTPGPRRIVFTLCQPCTAKSHGKLVLLGSMWTRIRAGGGSVVVSTQAHPGGEIRGLVKRS
jgi:hypothetical protein